MSRLDEIFEHKRAEVADAKRTVSFAALREAASEADPPRGFLRALQSSRHPLALIAEVKKASPSQGMIRSDLDPVEVATAYERAGADALSVLTDAKYFEGSPENLRRARAATSLPCLRKDFIEEPYQVFEARAMGADAILLILAALEDGRASDLLGLAEALGMDVLVEVHDEGEADRALAIGANLIGVNNRSLADFSTDLRTAEGILPKLAGRFTVAESALSTSADLEKMRKAGADAVLIGTAFCMARDIEATVREVMGW